MAKTAARKTWEQRKVHLKHIYDNDLDECRRIKVNSGGGGRHEGGTQTKDTQNDTLIERFSYSCPSGLSDQTSFKDKI